MKKDDGPVDPPEKSERAVERTYEVARWEASIEEGMDRGYKRMGKESGFETNE